MISLHRFAGLFLLLLITACGGSEGAGPQTRITEFGLFARGAEIILPNPDTPSGQSRATAGFKLETTTQNVPLVLGVSFGFCFEVSGVPAGSRPNVEVRVEHPAFSRPGRAPTSSFAFRPPLYTFGGVFWTCVGYGFDHPFELVAGTWRFTVLVDGAAPVMQEFFAR
jgi:hypothetical protein